MGWTPLVRIPGLRFSLQTSTHLTLGTGAARHGPLPVGVANHQGGLFKGHSLMMPLFGEEEGIWKGGEKTVRSLRHCLKLWNSRGRSWGVRGLQVRPDRKKTTLEMLCS